MVWTGKIKQIDEVRWEIPQDYKRGMRVPARIFADKALLDEIRRDLTLEQSANVSFLQGIYKYSITLPDGHQGYGFPIGGVAATDAETGVISPGGVGYDVNCLVPGTLILTRDGYRRPIGDLKNCWAHSKLTVFNLNDHEAENASIIRFIEFPPNTELHRLRTANGREITLTGDHPILTPRGMCLARKIHPGTPVAVYPFEGVDYNPPPDETILEERDFEPSVAKELKKRGFLPIHMNHPKIGTLARLVGYILGDGWFNTWVERRKDRKSPRHRLIVGISGEIDGLEKLREDIQSLGFKPSRIYSRSRRQTIKTPYGWFETNCSENCIHISSKSLATLINKLGVPLGSKVFADFEVPSWIRSAPLWIKRNFLAGFFGAELSKPSVVKEHPYTFNVPSIIISKRRNIKDSGYKFLNQIRALLGEFGIKTLEIYEIPLTKSTVGLRLPISKNDENLLRLWSKISYEFNEERRLRAALAAEYLRLKLKHRGMLKDRSKPIAFPTFNEYVEKTKAELGRSGLVYDIVVKKEIVRGFKGFVYDFTVNHEDHNFVADCFVVSNCGVRLLRTDLNRKDIEPKLRELVDALFRNVPSGLGSRGKMRLTMAQLDEVLERGARWAVENGFGWPEDLERLEEGGEMAGADAARVSVLAKQRGLPQLGSLGSGNHFLEIQCVDKIFDPDVAQKFGLTHEGQVTVMIHCGSRGLGHQVCSDYLRTMEHAVRQYKIELPDRELVNVPVTSPEGQAYFSAMACAANYAWANRQMIVHWVRESFEHVLGRDAESLGLHIVYDVAHNIAKLEEHKIDGERRKAYVHRKGSTRAFPPGHPDVPSIYREVGQPVLIPGDMGTASYVLVGTEQGMRETFASTAHGSGRHLSRTAARKRYWGQDIKRRLEAQGIITRCAKISVMAEECPEAYKDVDKVVKVSHDAGIARMVARLKPMGVAKG